MANLLKRGNHKLSSKIGIWTLPRSTCIGAGECRKWCYAKKMETMPNVMKSRLARYGDTLKPDFVDKMVAEIKKRKFTIIRIHESGDFYKQEYLEKWFEIAKSCPDVIFFTYTKTFEYLNWFNTLENLIVFQSFGSDHDNMIDIGDNTARVIDDIKDIKQIEYLCPYHDSNFKKCGETCDMCIRNDGKVKHIAFLKH